MSEKEEQNATPTPNVSSSSKQATAAPSEAQPEAKPGAIKMPSADDIDKAKATAGLFGIDIDGLMDKLAKLDPDADQEWRDNTDDKLNAIALLLKQIADKVAQL